MGDAFELTLLALFLSAAAVFVVLHVLDAPYGRHHRGGFGPTLPAPWAWVLMESPAVLFFVWIFVRGHNASALVPRVFLGLWLLHYVHRTFVYPLRIRPGARPTPWLVVGAGFVFQVANSFVNARWISSNDANYVDSYLADPRFVCGVALFWVGFVTNRWADGVLRRLRRSGDTGYQIPRGGLYEYVSCPNYLGELVIWVGWAVATWSLAGLSFAVFTAANLVPRARAHHRWFQREFSDYPTARKAIVPFVL